MPRAAPRFALAHRAGSQFPLVAAVWGVVAVCAALAGFAAALAGPGYDHALSASVAAIDTSEDGTDVTSLTAIAEDLGDVEPISVADAVDIATAQLAATAGDYPSEISMWVAGRMTYLDGEVPRRGYLLDADTADENSTLDSGRWPVAASGAVLEAAIPSNVAALLGLDLGDTLRLGGEERVDGTTAPFTDVTIVGTFTPQGAEWSRDPLRGSGIDAVTGGVQQVGPFLTAPGELSRTPHDLGRISAEMDPALGNDPSGIAAVVRATAALRSEARDAYGDAVRWVVVRSDLGTAYAEASAHVRLSTSLALSVLITLMAVAVAAVALMAELVARRRTAETAVLTDRGASRGQLARRAGIEGAALGVLAVIVAAPLSWFAYAAISRSTVFGPTWALGAPAPASPPPSVWIGAGIAALAAVGVLTAVALRDRGRVPFGARSRAGALARSGADLALAVIAVVGIVQLKTHTPADGRVDPLLVVVPAACVLASAALVARSLPRVARLAERVPRRSAGIASALAGWHVARGGAMRGTFLAVAAAATATLGTVFLATWSQSLGDQADAAVGADAIVAQQHPEGGGGGLAETASTRLQPVVDRAVVLGSRPEGVALFAIDSEAAAATVTGRPEGVDSWEDAVSTLGAVEASDVIQVRGPQVSLEISGVLNAPSGSSPPIAIAVVPSVVVSDPWGETFVLAGDPTALDGSIHAVSASLPPGTATPDSPWTVQAIQLQVRQTVTGDIFVLGSEFAEAEVAVTIRDAEGVAETWGGSGDDGSALLEPSTITAQGSTVSAAFRYSIFRIGPSGAPLTLVPFEPSDEVPVLLSADLAADAGLAPGDSIAVGTESGTVNAVVAGTVGYVPGHVHAPALWADRESLRRALLSVGSLDLVTDAWWGSPVDSSGIAALREQGYGPVTSRAERGSELRNDPAQVPLRLAWLLAVVAAAALTVTGGAAHAAAEAQHRSLTLARLRAIGVGRRDALRSHMWQHALAMGGAVCAGIAAGLILSALIAPALVVSPAGQRPVPSAVLVLPWPALVAVCGGMLALVLAAGVPAARAAVSRSTVAALRAGEVT